MKNSEVLIEKLNALYTDFLMLQDAEWIPDYDSVDASIDTLRDIHKSLLEAKLLPEDNTLTDLREED